MNIQISAAMLEWRTNSLGRPERWLYLGGMKIAEIFPFSHDGITTKFLGRVLSENLRTIKGEYEDEASARAAVEAEVKTILEE